MVYSREKWLNIAKDFDLPNILDALDGKHIIVFRPLKKYGSAFYNCKNSHSIVLLALVDANLMLGVMEEYLMEVYL